LEVSGRQQLVDIVVQFSSQLVALGFLGLQVARLFLFAAGFDFAGALLHFAALGNIGGYSKIFGHSPLVS